MGETRQKQKRIVYRYFFLLFGILAVIIASIVLALTQKPDQTPAAAQQQSVAQTASLRPEPTPTFAEGVEALPTPAPTVIMPEKQTQENFGRVTMWEADEETYRQLLEATEATPAVPRAPVPMVDKLVVIDAGHGGFDGGALGTITGVHEDDLNLAVALKLKEIFENNEYSVLMTRGGENAIARTKLDDMRKRYSIIENAGSEVTISIHMNHYPDPAVHGAQVFYFPNSSHGKVLADMVTAEIENTVNPARMRDVMAEEYYVLKAGNAPSVLIECGFLSNAAEEAKLMDDAYQIKLAQAIFNAADKYMDTY